MRLFSTGLGYKADEHGAYKGVTTKPCRCTQQLVRTVFDSIVPIFLSDAFFHASLWHNVQLITPLDHTHSLRVKPRL